MSANDYSRKIPKLGEIITQGFIVGKDKRIVPPNEVEHLASLGCTDRDIAEYFSITESTLRYNLSAFLIKGRHQLKTTLRQKQIQVALEGNPTMLIWLGKNILSQSDSGMASAENRPLPWTDNDEDTIDELDDDVIEQNDE